MKLHDGIILLGKSLIGKRRVGNNLLDRSYLFDNTTEMDENEVRSKVRKLIDEMGFTAKSLSERIGKNHAYLQQYLEYGKPRILPEAVRLALASELGVDEQELRVARPALRDVDRWRTETELERMRIEKERAEREARRASERAAVLEQHIMIAERRGAAEAARGAMFAEEALRVKTTSIPEIDIRGGAGGGGLPSGEAVAQAGDYSSAADIARGFWSFPQDYLTSELRLNRERARIIAVLGDSMEPTLASGDRVMIDTEDKVASPPGIFALWDGYGIVVKRLEPIPKSDPPSIRVMSDNARHREYEVSFEEANIIGRVVWFARRL